MRVAPPRNTEIIPPASMISVAADGSGTAAAVSPKPDGSPSVVSLSITASEEKDFGLPTNAMRLDVVPPVVPPPAVTMSDKNVVSSV